MGYEIWINGEFVEREKAMVSLFDRGFMPGDAIFDTERTFNGKVFKLREHLLRFYRSLKYIRLDPMMPIEEMERLTLQVVERNEELRKGLNDDYMISQVVSGGVGYHAGQDPSITGRGNPPTVAIKIDPLESPAWVHAYDTGFNLVIPKTRSYSSESLDPKVKHYSRLNFVLAELEATDADPDSKPLLLDDNGNVSESSGANFFVVTDGVLRTPRIQNTLQGVSRQTVMDLAKQLNIPVSEENLQPYDVYTADEAFLCSTPYCILPVGHVDKRQIGQEVPGDVTNQLLSAWSEIVGLDIVDQLRRLPS